MRGDERGTMMKTHEARLSGPSRALYLGGNTLVGLRAASATVVPRGRRRSAGATEPAISGVGTVARKSRSRKWRSSVCTGQLKQAPSGITACVPR